MLSMVAGLAVAHEVEPTVADVEVGGEAVTIRLRTALEPLIAGVDLSTVEDTDDSPLSERHDALRDLPPELLRSELDDAWSGIREGLALRAGDTPLQLQLQEVEIPEVGDTDIRRDSLLTLTAPLPDDGSPVTMGADPAFGTLIVRQGDETEGYTAYLTGGDLTEPMPRDGVVSQSLGAAVWTYVVSGFDHIVPKGLDHILFVLGLFFYALAWRPLLWQVTAFTAAHTVTLALATTGVVNIPDDAMWIVESIIAASIVYVAVENLLVIRRSRDMAAAIARGGPVEERFIEMPHIGWTRIAVVFAFGLLHGLGFASVLAEFGLGQHFVASLIAFNVGVEIGQLFVIAVAFAVLLLAFRVMGRRLSPVAEGFHAVAIVGSLLIAAVGAWWVIERTILG